MNSILHLAENVKELGSLDKFSAFLFENYLQHLEWVVRSTAISRSPCGMCLARTNNRVEEWHNKLNRAIGHSHPNTHELISVLKKEQTSTKETLQ